MSAEGRTLDRRLAILFGILGLLVGLASVPASLWEWDEILFARGLHAYDVALHSPHPPGFPVYVFAARAVKFIVADDKTALCLVGLAFAFLLGAAAYTVFREIFGDRRTASAATALLLFFPPVMLYAGAPRSDAPGLAAGLLATALAFKGRTSARALAAAGLALGLGFGVRVTVLMAAGPVLIGVSLAYLARRQWKPVLVSAGLAVAGVLAGYVPAVLLTGWERYREAMKGHALYTSSMDTVFGADVNRLLSRRFGRFFADVWGEPGAVIAVCLLAAAGAAVLISLRRGRALGRLALAFLPVLVFTFLYMTPLAGPLYALPYLPLFAALISAALVPPRRPGTPAGRWDRLRPAGWILTGAFVVLSFAWTMPMLKMRRGEDSPTWRAVEHILETRDPETMDLYYDRVFLPFVRFNFGAYNCIPFKKTAPRAFNLLNPAADARDAFTLTPRQLDEYGGERFAWSDPRGAARLDRLSLGRFEEVFVTTLEKRRKIVYGPGWHAEEHGDGQVWRWMGGRSETELLALTGEMTLRLKAAAHPGILKPGEKAAIILLLDGREIDRIETAGGVFERTVVVKTPPPSPWKKLVIECGRAVIPAAVNLNSDTRELALQVFDLAWEAGPEAGPIAYRQGSFIADGWHRPERESRWTRKEARLKLPRISLPARLDLQMEIPLGPDRKRARVILEINGRRLDVFDPPAGVFFRSYLVSPEIHGGGEASLRISVSRTVEAQFGRHLGARLYSVSWMPVEPGRETPGGSGKGD